MGYLTISSLLVVYGAFSLYRTKSDHVRNLQSRDDKSKRCNSISKCVRYQEEMRRCRLMLNGDLLVHNLLK
ncbi:hypothetical protein D918_09521 [Trichuris suis]|nr:hypothetical protein D918_09521 [Trichuris suis]